MAPQLIAVLGSATSEKGCPGSTLHPVPPTPPAAQTTPHREEDPHCERPAWDDCHEDPAGGRGEAEGRVTSWEGTAQLACLTRGAPGSVPGDAGSVAVPGGSQVSLQAEPQCQSFCYSRAKLRGLLLEGASLLLLRVLACRQTTPPDLVFPAMDTEGDLCTSSYVRNQPGGPMGCGSLGRVEDTRVGCGKWKWAECG